MKSHQTFIAGLLIFTSFSAMAGDKIRLTFNGASAERVNRILSKPSMSAMKKIFSCQKESTYLGFGKPKITCSFIYESLSVSLFHTSFSSPFASGRIVGIANTSAKPVFNFMKSLHLSKSAEVTTRKQIIEEQCYCRTPETGTMTYFENELLSCNDSPIQSYTYEACSLGQVSLNDMVEVENLTTGKVYGENEHF